MNLRISKRDYLIGCALVVLYAFAAGCVLSLGGCSDSPEAVELDSPATTAQYAAQERARVGR